MILCGLLPDAFVREGSALLLPRHSISLRLLLRLGNRLILLGGVGGRLLRGLQFLGRSGQQPLGPVDDGGVRGKEHPSRIRETGLELVLAVLPVFLVAGLRASVQEIEVALPFDPHTLLRLALAGDQLIDLQKRLVIRQYLLTGRDGRGGGVQILPVERILRGPNRCFERDQTLVVPLLLQLRVDIRRRCPGCLARNPGGAGGVARIPGLRGVREHFRDIRAAAARSIETLLQIGKRLRFRVDRAGLIELALGDVEVGFRRSGFQLRFDLMDERIYAVAPRAIGCSKHKFRVDLLRSRRLLAGGVEVAVAPGACRRLLERREIGALLLARGNVFVRDGDRHRRRGLAEYDVVGVTDFDGRLYRASGGALHPCFTRGGIARHRCAFADGPAISDLSRRRRRRHIGSQGDVLMRGDLLAQRDQSLSRPPDDRTRCRIVERRAEVGDAYAVGPRGDGN